MTLTTLGKTRGFSCSGLNVPGNSKVWKYYSQAFDDEILEGLKSYSRTPASLSNLYTSLLDFDVPAVNDLPHDPDFQVVYDHVTELFRPTTPYRVHPLSAISRHDLPQMTNPGYPYFFEGHTKKIYAWRDAMDDSWKMFDRAQRKNAEIEFYPALIFAKGAIVERGKTKTRFINGESLSTILLETMYAKAIESHQYTGQTPAAYEYTPFGDGYGKLHDDLYRAVNYDHPGYQIVTFDFKAYDKSGINELTRRIYATYLSYFDLSEDVRGKTLNFRQRRSYVKIFRAIEEHHINTSMIMPDGFIYRKDLGDNSGSKMFQKIQNFRTAFLNCLVWYKITGALPAMVKTLGDDSISASRLKSGQQLITIEAAAEIVGKYNFKLSVQKCVISTSTMTNVEFLGRRLMFRQSTRASAEILLRVLYPARPDYSDVDLAMRIVAMYYENSGGNAALSRLLSELWYFCIPYSLRSKLANVDVDWSPHFRKLFKMLGLTGLPRCQLPDDVKLFALVRSKRADREPNSNKLP